MKCYSQYGQDVFIHELINKKNGFFIDIGAHDGISLSNTYAFEKELEWNGICIEPLPHVFKQLQKNRNCILENCAISNIEGVLDFVSIYGPVDAGEMLSGFGREKMAKSINKSYNIIKVNTYRLDTILDKHNIKHADFCSIDTETTEIDVIKSIDWNKYQIDYLCIEKNQQEEKIISYLKPYGYIFIKDMGKDKYEGDIILKKIY